MTAEVHEPLGPELELRLRPQGRIRTFIASEFVWQIGETIATRVLLVAIGLATTILVARTLGPVGRGEYAVAVTIAAVAVQVGNLGLHTSSSWRVARDPGALNTLLANGLLMSIVVGAALAAGIWLATQTVLSPAPLPAELLLLSLASIPLGLIYLNMQNLLLGLRRVREFNLLEIGNRSGALVIIGVAALAGSVTTMSAYGAVVGGLAAASLAAVVRLARGRLRQLRPSLALLREQGAYGLVAYSGALLTFLVFRLDLLMVQYIKGSADAGQYSISLALGDLLYMVPVVIATLLFPRLSIMRDERRKWHLARAIAVAAGAIEVAFALASCVVGESVLTTLFGPAFRPAFTAFVWLLPGLVFLSSQTILTNYFFAVGAPRIIVVAPAVALILNVALNLWLVPANGIVGAAMSSNFAYATMLLISLVYFRRVAPA